MAMLLPLCAVLMPYAALRHDREERISRYFSSLLAADAAPCHCDAAAATMPRAMPCRRSPPPFHHAAFDAAMRHAAISRCRVADAAALR